MKKLIPMMLVLALLLCACGGSNPPAGTVTTTPPETTPATTEPAQTVPVTTAPAETEPVTEPANTMSLGRIEGGTYINSYMGFAIDLDSTWTYYTAEELQELPENVSEMLSGTEFEDDVLNNITDMMAESAEYLATINVQYQKLDMATRLAYAAMSDDAILDLALTEVDAMAAAYEQMGLTDAAFSKTTAIFLGEEVPALMTTYLMDGIPCYCLQVFDYHLGQYSCTITFTSFLEDNTADLASMCYAIEG